MHVSALRTEACTRASPQWTIFATCFDAADRDVLAALDAVVYSILTRGKTAETKLFPNQAAEEVWSAAREFSKSTTVHLTNIK